jgi:hypothetical protein
MEQRIIYVGLDVHKDTIAVALAEAGKRGELREYGKIANTPAALRTLAAKLASHGWCLRLPVRAMQKWRLACKVEKTLRAASGTRGRAGAQP